MPYYYNGTIPFLTADMASYQPDDLLGLLIVRRMILIEHFYARHH